MEHQTEDEYQQTLTSYNISTCAAKGDAGPTLRQRGGIETYFLPHTVQPMHASWRNIRRELGTKQALCSHHMRSRAGVLP